MASMVFKFKMLCDENDSFVRDYEVLYDMNLIDFHDFICDDLGYDHSVMSSFFTSNEQWEKLQEYTLVNMGDEGHAECCIPLPMEGVMLGQIIHKKNDRLIFLFDVFRDRGLFLELLEAKESESGKSYPEVSSAKGEAPDQFDPSEIDDEDDSLFYDALEDTLEFTGDDHYDHYEEEF